MSLVEELDALRAAVPHCRVVAYVDLGAELVLTARPGKSMRQEALDALAQQAVRLLHKSQPLLGDAGPADQAVALSDDGLVVFLRDADEPGEALCCLCAPAADPDAVLTAARDALTRINAAG